MDWSLSGVPGREYVIPLARAVNATSTPTYNIDDSVYLAVNQATGKLLVDIGSGGTSGTQYVSPTTVTNPTGTLAMAQYLSGATTLTNGQVFTNLVDASGNLLVNVAAGGTSGVVTQSSGTPGKSGMLIQGAVTTAKPTYTTGQTNPVSMDVNGLIRVSLADTPANTNKFLVTPDSVALPANQSVNVNQIGGGAIALGLTTMAASMPVVIASNQTAIPMSGTVTANAGTGTFNIQANASTNLAQVGGAAIALGATTMAASMPVVIASNQNPISVGVTNTTFPSTQSGTWTVQPGNTPNSTPWLVSFQPATSGGWSTSFAATLTNVAVQAKASAGQVGGWYVYNPNTVVSFIQIFNATAATVTAGTTTPTMSLGIPASSGANVEFSNGIAFGTAISYLAATTASGGTNPTTALVANLIYK